MTYNNYTKENNNYKTIIFILYMLILEVIIEEKKEGLSFILFYILQSKETVRIGLFMVTFFKGKYLKFSIIQI